ncbi:hypothetical protein V6N11_043289 [Hibiscus sabdariffa]|uniref:Uncharacterized protein n=1 Tax=Hibiscus sabdariffa TaxID=183260 RepID=A0ABR2QYZ0_9ROSI
MKNLRNGHGDRWLVIGYSNVVSSQDEKLGGMPFNPNDANSYFDFIDSRGLIDMPISGGAFTWSNQRRNEEAILEKLDRVLCSPEWSILFPKVVAILDIAIGSDHALVIIHLQGLKKKYKKEFQFESKWLLEEDCTLTVQRSWEPTSQPRNSHRFGSKLRKTKYTLIRWSKLKDRVKSQRKMELQRRIKYYQGKQLSKEELCDSKACQKELDVMNVFVFQGLVETPLEVRNRVEGAFREFSNAQPKISIRVLPLQAESFSWIPPSMGHFKVCCDAAFDKHTSKAVATAVARDSTCAILSSAFDCFCASSASSVEVLAIRMGVSLALNVDEMFNSPSSSLSPSCRSPGSITSSKFKTSRIKMSESQGQGTQSSQSSSPSKVSGPTLMRNKSV